MLLLLINVVKPTANIQSNISHRETRSGTLGGCPRTCMAGFRQGEANDGCPTSLFLHVRRHCHCSKGTLKTSFYLSRPTVLLESWVKWNNHGFLLVRWGTKASIVSTPEWKSLSWLQFQSYASLNTIFHIPPGWKQLWHKAMKSWRWMERVVPT